MGLIVSRMFDVFAGLKPRRVVFLGLDAAGKTTVLYKMNLGEVVHTIPTIGFNVETVKHKNLEFTCWDIGGQKKIRALWYHYYQGTDAVIFVIDSNDKHRLEEAKEELYQTMNNDLLKGAALLVLANKQDLPNVMSPAEIVDKLELAHNFRARPWQVQGCVAVNGSGLYEGLDWLAKTLQQQ
ncbi:unnamed protein product [Ectocarpus fasciculatus]